MTIDLRNTPITKTISIDDDFFTFECTCGRHFTSGKGCVSINNRCEVCEEVSNTSNPLTNIEELELATYFYENVILEYNNRLNKV